MTQRAKKARSGPREGHPYPVKQPWQEDVLAELEKRGITEKAFAKKAHCAQSTMHDLLHDPEAKHSTLVPVVHSLLGWDPPPDPQMSPPLPSPDAIEMANMFDRLPEELKKKLRDDAKFYLALSDRKD